METFETEVNLDVERSKLKQKFAQLMDDDLLLEEGRKDELKAKQQLRLRRTKLELQDIVTKLSTLR